MKKVIIFEVGRKAREIVRKVGREHVECFADSSPENLRPIMGIPVISVPEMIRRWPECDIILSINSAKLENILKEHGISYWKNDSLQNSYFMRQDVMDVIDEKLLDRYHYDMDAKYGLFSEKYNDRFREAYFSEENRVLVEAFIENNDEKVREIFNRVYAPSELLYDEYFENRPGLRLIKHIITEYSIFQQRREFLEICDIACGHGELLKRLKEDGFRVRGVEGAPARVEEVRQSGIECVCANVEHVPLPDGSLDVIICTECLEHVKDPVAVLKEVNRLLIRGGMVFVTTPYGSFCDCDTHLRHFYENNLCALFLQNGFEIENVLRIPYLNNSVNDNLFVAAIKK